MIVLHKKNVEGIQVVIGERIFKLLNNTPQASEASVEAGALEARSLDS